MLPDNPVPENAENAQAALVVDAADKMEGLGCELDAISGRLALLAGEARERGLNVAFVVGGYDPFTCHTGMRYGYAGDPYAVEGLLTMARVHIAASL